MCLLKDTCCSLVNCRTADSNHHMDVTDSRRQAVTCMPLCIYEVEWKKQ